MIKAAIFDMDGILIDSEPYWREADMAIYATVGLMLTEDMCLETLGMSTKGAVEYWYNKFPWKSTKTHHELQLEIENFVINKIVAEGKAMSGVDYILHYFENKNIKCALASSSYMNVINAVVDTLVLRPRLKVIHSAEYEKAGKPAPDVFLGTARLLGVKPEECLVFEDSVNGVNAALAAGMKVIAVPEAHMQSDERYNVAHLKLKNLLEYKGQLLNI